MGKMKVSKTLLVRTLPLSGIIAAIFYLSHVIGRGMLWRRVKDELRRTMDFRLRIKNNLDYEYVDF